MRKRNKKNVQHEEVEAEPDSPGTSKMEMLILIFNFVNFCYKALHLRCL